ncbi:MAG TPA: SNF2-related protein [Candidatus Thermoplasmatota archaeon]|nr:SNF2-related protein [Candidatus Thermoplasmatota archaeon]
MTLPPNVSRGDLERLYGALFQPGSEIDELARYSRNSGFVEKVVVGASAAQGRVRGRRRDTGFNVRIHYSGTFTCKCPRARKQPCEHVGALLLHVIAQLGEAAATGATKLNPQEPAPEVYQFLLDLFPGIGPKRAREVARVFRTVPDLLQATPRQLRNLPEIGVWAAQVLHEHLQKHQQIGFRAARPREEESDEPKPQVAPDMEWVRDAPKTHEVDASGDSRTRLNGAVILVQGTRTGAVFFRPEDQKDPLMRRALKHIRSTDPGSFRPSLKHHIWTTDQERFPRVIGRLEAMGARREHRHLVDLPLDGLTLFFDAAGRRSRFQFASEALEEGFPRALDMLKSAEGYTYDEVSAQHLVLPRAFPMLKSELADLGALLIRKRLRPVREIAEWKEEEPEDFAEGTPRIRPLPDVSPFMGEPLPASLKAHVQLRPYQREGVAFIRATDYLTYLGDPPGLGKCVAPDSVVHLADGRATMEQLWTRPHRVIERDDEGGEWALLDEPITVDAFDPQRGIVPLKVQKLYRQRVREPLYRVRLTDGAELASTWRHRYFTPDASWTEAGRLAPGDRVAVPAFTNHLGDNGLDPRLAELMAWQVAEGSEHANNPSRTPVWAFHNADPRVLQRVLGLARDLGVDLKPPRRTRGDVHVILTSKLRHLFYPWGYAECRRSAAKEIPPGVFGASLDAQRAFLQAFFEAEGCVNATHVELTTASRSVAYGLRDLLRNFGVWLRIAPTRKRATNGSRTYRTYYRCTLGGASVARFCASFRFLSERKQAALDALAAIPRRSNVEGVPVAGVLNVARDDTGIPYGRIDGLTVEHARGKGVSKARVASAALALQRQGRADLADELRVIGSSAVHWAEVADVERQDHDGYVYDLEVPGLHNYVVNGVLTHNTLQAITAALYLPGRILVIAPAGARDVWKREIESHTTESVFVFRPTSKKTPTNEKFVVASYDALLSRQDQLLKVKPDLVILDEAHYVKNKEAERTKAVHDSLISIPRRLLLSGTPAMNRVDEVRKQLEFIHPGEWGNEHWFRRRFVQPLEQGTPEVRMQVLSRLREYFQGVMLRRQKADVLKDLPPKHVIVNQVKLPPMWRQEYNEEAARLRDHINTHRETAFGDDYGTTRGHIMTLRQLASNGKGEAAEAYVRRILEVKGEKIVVFAYYLQHLETLEKSLAEFNPVVVHGGVNDKARDNAVQTFQHDPTCRIFLGQITAAGTALTLTAARHAIFVDLDWNPANHEQAGDRIHRIGQTREVFLHYLVAGGTIDEDIVKMLQEKSTTTAALLDADEQSAGLLQQRRESRNIARLALKVAMGEPIPESPAR